VPLQRPRQVSDVYPMSPNQILSRLLVVLSIALFPWHMPPEARGQEAVANADWIQLSNQRAQPALDVLAKYNPEAAGRYGVDHFDDAVLDLLPRVYERSRDDLRRVVKELEARMGEERHPKVKQDLQILITALNDNLASSELRHRRLLPYFNVPEIVFEGIRALLNPNVAKERHSAAVIRLRKYAGLISGIPSLADSAKERTAERFATDGLVGPYRVQVRKDIAKAKVYLSGIEDLMKEHRLEGWEEAHQALTKRIDAYNRWLESELIPRGRDDHRLPGELYADRLKSFGVRMSPDELIERGQFGFLEIRLQMSALAKRIAAERHWKESGYRDVIAALKREQLEESAILPHYRQRLKAIEEIITTNKIVTLPKRDARIRIASAAESARIPAPSMQPPRLIGNTGEYGEFLIPLRNPSAESDDKFDDFLHDAISWSLTAHEARPGHEMQFSAMIENGVSIPRAVFAWNSANVEGWGLYAEAIVMEYLPLEGQFCTLYMRLLRAARAFLDPMVNQGRMSPQEAKAFLMRELLLSEPMAAQEVDRYTFQMPGQAPSYYYGLMKLQALRVKVELQLGSRFDQRAFHDFILAQGLLPLELLEEIVLAEFAVR
jgi:uncharacterized protein (DUF885 family)